MMQCLIRSVQHVTRAACPRAARIQPVPKSAFVRCLASQASSSSDKTVWIRLVDEHGKILGNRRKSEAEALAAKRHMILVRIEGQSDVQKTISYKFVSPKEELIQPAKRSSEKNAGLPVKSIQIGAKSAENDIRTKTRQIQNWLSKGAEIRVAIVGSPETKDHVLENVFTTMETFWKGTPLRILQKRIKPGSLKFTITPPKNASRDVNTSQVKEDITTQANT